MKEAAEIGFFVVDDIDAVPRVSPRGSEWVRLEVPGNRASINVGLIGTPDEIHRLADRLHAAADRLSDLTRPRHRPVES